MKKFLKNVLLVVMMLVIFTSCAPNGLKAKATDIAQKFYTEYLKAQTEEKIKKIKSKYMTEVLVEELEYRTWQMEADAVTGVQDSFGMLEKMTVTEGENDEWAKVTFDMKKEEGVPYNIYEANIHFRNVKNRRLMDTFNLIIYEVDADGDKTATEFLTKYANKETLTEEDKAEMANIKKYYEDLFAEGYIG